MLNPQVDKTRMLYEQFEWRQNIINNFEVQQIEKQIKITHGPRTYFIILEKNIWYLKPFKDSVFCIEVNDFIDVNILLDAIAEDQDFYRGSVLR